MSDGQNNDNATLVGLVKDKCRITWEDDDTERVIGEIVDSACSVIRFKLGIPEDAESTSTSQGLSNASSSTTATTLGTTRRMTSRATTPPISPTPAECGR